MFAPLPFALHATTGCPPHAELALSLAYAFEDVDAMALDGDLETLARHLPPPASSHPLAELKSLARVGPRGEAPDDVGTEGLLLHTVLSARTPHPLALAIVTVEVGRRRGISVGIVSNGEDHLVGHTDLPAPLLLEVESGKIVAADLVRPTLTWRCAHETAGLVLDELEPRWLAQGRIDLALRAAELRMCLPFDENGKRVAGGRLERVRARLN
jgi:hypothetical protein